MTAFGEIIPFGSSHDQRLVQIPAADIETLTSDELEVNNEAYLGTDLFQGMYGVTSFGVVVPRPNNRPRYYNAQEGPCGDYEEEDLEFALEITENPIRKAHYIDTKLGFAVVRTVIAPSEVLARLHSQRFIGPAIIDKCCLDDTIPSDFDEDLELGLGQALGHDKAKGIDVAQKRVVNQVEATTGKLYAFVREYPSWHSYRVYASVMNQVTEACKATVANFDEVLMMINSDLTPLHPFDPDTPLGRIALNPNTSE